MAEAETETVPNVHQRLAAAMADITAVGKEQYNKQQNFKYRGIDDVYNAINPVLAKHGLFMTSDILDKSREERQSKQGGVLVFTCMRMKYTFWAADGSSLSTIVEGEGMDSGDKSSNKAMAVAHKYALLQAFCIPTDSIDDPDAHSHEIGGEPKQQTPPPRQNGKQTPEQWAEEQHKLIETMTTRKEIDEWFEKNKRALDALAKKNEELHGDLLGFAMYRLGEMPEEATEAAE